MENAAKTISKLRKLAAGTGQEAETASEILRQLCAQHPEAAQAIEEPTKDVWFPARNWHDRALMERLCFYLDCEAYQKRGRGSEGIYMRGPASVVDAAPAIYKTLAKRLADLHRGTTIGFLVGALPLPKSEQEDGGSKKTEELSAEALEAARTALEIGVRAQPRRQLEGRAR